MSNANADELINKGSLHLDCDLPVPTDSTILIVGQARAGTSMVSNLLNELGVHMGDEIGPVYEDNELGLFVKDLANGKVTDDFRNCVEKRNTEYQKWGWKRPDLYSYLEVVLPYIRNPRLIFCFRDIVAISTRNIIALSDSTDKREVEPLSLLNEALAVQKKTLELIQSFKIPSLLLSYEKAFSLPESFLFTLTQFVGLSMSIEKQNRLLKLIQPNHLGYSLRARKESFGKACTNIGILKSIENGILKGVFKIKYASTNVELWCDGVKVSTIQLIKRRKSGFHDLNIDISPFKRRKNHFFELKFDDGTHFLNSPYFWAKI